MSAKTHQQERRVSVDKHSLSDVVWIPVLLVQDHGLNPIEWRIELKSTQSFRELHRFPDKAQCCRAFQHFVSWKAALLPPLQQEQLGLFRIKLPAFPDIADQLRSAPNSKRVDYLAGMRLNSRGRDSKEIRDLLVRQTAGNKLRDQPLHLGKLD